MSTLCGMKRKSNKSRKPQSVPTPLRIEQEMRSRIERIAEKSELPASVVMRKILKAGAVAVEKAGYRMPPAIEFIVRDTKASAA